MTVFHLNAVTNLVSINFISVSSQSLFNTRQLNTNDKINLKERSDQKCQTIDL